MRLSDDLKQPIWLYAKGVLFVILGAVAGATLLLRNPDWTNAALLALAVWAFCRAYYFAFYVIQHYVDGRYRFAGLIDFAQYSLKWGRWRKEHD